MGDKTYVDGDFFRSSLILLRVAEIFEPLLPLIFVKAGLFLSCGSKSARLSPVLLIKYSNYLELRSVYSIKDSFELII